MRLTITRSALCEAEWHVYSPSYRGEIMLRSGVYEARPFRRAGGNTWPIASFSEINLAADYLVEANGV